LAPGFCLYLRPVGSWMRFIITFALSLAAANVFAHDLRVGAAHIGVELSDATCGALVALTCWRRPWPAESHQAADFIARPGRGNRNEPHPRIVAYVGHEEGLVAEAYKEQQRHLDMGAGRRRDQRI
jgi:hypothetical protein